MEKILDASGIVKMHILRTHLSPSTAALFAFFFGLVWWSLIFLCFGSSVEVTSVAGITSERTIPRFRRLGYVPFLAVFWAFVAIMTVAMANYLKSTIVAGLSGIGFVIGLGISLILHPFDGWQVMTQSTYSLFGLIVGFGLSSCVLFLVRRC